MAGDGGTISRRAFVGLAGAAALSASALLGGCTSGSQQGAESDGVGFPFVSQPTSTAEPIAAVPAPHEWDGTYNVVVCGSGGGLVAACRCAELGAKVLVLEKESTFGGASKESAVFEVMGSAVQQTLYAAEVVHLAAAGGDPVLAQRLETLAQTDPASLRDGWIADHLPGPGVGMPASWATSEGLTLPDGTVGDLLTQVDAPLMTSVGRSIPLVVDYLTSLGISWSLATTLGPRGYVTGLVPEGQETGGFVARADYTIFETLFNKAQELGAEIILNREVTALVTDDDGAVLGVRCDDIYYRATKGVLLACGGMANNRDLLEVWCPGAASRCLSTSVMGGDTGAGIRMGLGAHAAIAGFDSFLGVDGGLAGDSWTRYLYRGDVQLARQPWLGIGLDGRRYPYYRASGVGSAWQGGILGNLPGANGYAIFDDDYADTIATWEEDGTCQWGARRPISPSMGEGMAEKAGAFARLDGTYCAGDYTSEVQEALDSGLFVTGNSADDLATAIGLPAATVEKAIDDWNALCLAGADSVCHMDPAWLVPLRAPYHACRVGMTCLATFCGLSVLPTQQVLSETGAPIPGLYASGCTMGGLSGSSTFGACRHPGGGVAMAAGTAYTAAGSIMGVA